VLCEQNTEVQWREHRELLRLLEPITIFPFITKET
jgi:hypothetical protein